MRFTIISAALFVATSPALACEGDISIFMEKRPIGSSDDYSVIEESKLDSKSGVITVCGRDRSWDGGYETVGDGFSTTVGRRERTFAPAGGNVFLSNTYEAEHKGVKSEYRFRAER